MWIFVWFYGFASDFFVRKKHWKNCQITIVDYSKKCNSYLHVFINIEVEYPHYHVVWLRCYVCFDIHAIINYPACLLYKKKNLHVTCRNKIGIPVKMHVTICAGMQISHVDMRCVCRSVSNIWKHVTD